MCDHEIHPGLVEDWSVTRRTFVATGAAVAGFASACARAAETVVEREVAVTTPDGVADSVLFHPAGSGSWPAVLVWPDIMGLRPVFREMGRRLAAEGFVVLVPNPFYRSRKAPVIDGNFDFGNAEARQTLFAYRAAMSDAGVDRDAAAFLAFLDAQPQTARDRKAGVQGYCMGGPLSFRTAAAVPGRIGAVASFHGAGLATDRPDSPHLLIPRTEAAYLVAVAKNDDAREPEAKTVLTQALAAAGRPATVEVYAADHGWCVPGSQAYAHEAAERAWAELLRLYTAALA
jgi:carboxymethylenebutenolidase